MLIIFDLDDTLIDTSGCITPVKRREALAAMVKHGLTISDFSAALELLQRLDTTAQSFSHSLKEFAEIVGVSDQLVEVGLKDFYENISSDIPIFPLEDAIQVLEDLSLQHQLALVSFGKKNQQLSKLEKAGIDSGFFSKIIISEDRNKKTHYQSLAEEFGYAPENIVVCGDRIPFDLSPARELGFRTVQIRWGRGKSGNDSRAAVDCAIAQLKDLKDVISNFCV